MPETWAMKLGLMLHSAVGGLTSVQGVVGGDSGTAIVEEAALVRNRLMLTGVLLHIAPGPRRLDT
jgi:hypothetical protein